jgi:hypothetical protein
LIRKPGWPQRRIEDIASLGSLLAFDLDSTPIGLSDLRLKLYGISKVIYSTASSMPDDQHWRIVIGLDREYNVDEHARLWRWFAQRLPVDDRTKNANRISFCPARWNEFATFYAEDGRPCRVDDVLAMVPEVLPEPVIPADIRALQPARSGTVIVTEHMLARAQTAKPGSGRLFSLLCSAAKRHRLNGWALSAEELADAARDACTRFAPNVPRPNLLREAQNALVWAAQTCQPLSPLERMRERLRFEARLNESRVPR